LFSNWPNGELHKHSLHSAWFSLVSPKKLQSVRGCGAAATAAAGTPGGAPGTAGAGGTAGAWAHAAAAKPALVTSPMVKAFHVIMASVPFCFMGSDRSAGLHGVLLGACHRQAWSAWIHFDPESL
jgi:hypothetical protein